MFTGIITHTGQVKKWQPTKDGGRLVVTSKKKLPKVKLGESIAINGCCLTVVSSKDKTLGFDVSDETMRKTSLNQLAPGSVVSLERAMSAGGHFGGHFVLGHVDGVGRVQA